MLELPREEDSIGGRRLRKREEGQRPGRIRLSELCWVDPMQIVSVRVHGESGTISVLMQDGVKHQVRTDPRLGAWDTAYKLCAQVARMQRRATSMSVMKI